MNFGQSKNPSTQKMESKKVFDTVQHLLRSGYGFAVSNTSITKDSDGNYFFGDDFLDNIWQMMGNHDEEMVRDAFSYIVPEFPDVSEEGEYVIEATLLFDSGQRGEYDVWEILPHVYVDHVEFIRKGDLANIEIDEDYSWEDYGDLFPF